MGQRSEGNGENILELNENENKASETILKPRLWETYSSQSLSLKTIKSTKKWLNDTIQKFGRTRTSQIQTQLTARNSKTQRSYLKVSISMKVGIPEFGTCIFRIVVSSWLAIPSYMKCPSLSLLISFRSILSVISKWCLLAPGPIWLEDSVNPFYSMALLKAQCVSCRGQVDGFCFTIHSVSLYLLLESWGNWYF